MTFPLYLDEDVERVALARALRQLGFDVLRTTGAGMAGRTDEEQIEFALPLGRVLYTASRGDYARLHAWYVSSGRQHAGIVILGTQHIGVGEQARQLARLGAQHHSTDMVNRVEWLTRPPRSPHA